MAESIFDICGDAIVKVSIYARWRKLDRKRGIESVPERIEAIGNETDRNSTLEYHAKRFNSIRYHLAQPDGAVANCNDSVLRSNINSVSTTLCGNCK